MIKALDRDQVKKLVAGQLVVSASAVVREFVENALDAEATSITVKKNHNALNNKHTNKPANARTNKQRKKRTNKQPSKQTSLLGKNREGFWQDRGQGQRYQ